jgi:hypothetical protein
MAKTSTWLNVDRWVDGGVCEERNDDFDYGITMRGKEPCIPIGRFTVEPKRR